MRKTIDTTFLKSLFSTLTKSLKSQNLLQSFTQMNQHTCNIKLIYQYFVCIRTQLSEKNITDFLLGLYLCSTNCFSPEGHGFVTLFSDHTPMPFAVQVSLSMSNRSQANCICVLFRPQSPVALSRKAQSNLQILNISTYSFSLLAFWREQSQLPTQMRNIAMCG